MVERSVNSKGKNKREETEKLKAELERSLAVVKVKVAHKQIEDTEKSRKHAVVLSICKRIDLFCKQMTPVFTVLNKPQYRKLQPSEELRSTLETYEQAYASIRHDFQKSLDFGEEDMTKMFPTIKFKKDIVSHSLNGLLCAIEQLEQMKAYCERLLV